MTALSVRTTAPLRSLLSRSNFRMVETSLPPARRSFPVDQASFMRDIRRNFPTVLRTLDSCFVPLAARSDVVLTASSEPCPPSTITLRTLLLRQCCVARRSPGS
ncbi:hypothetical protein CHARACLAT_018591 [Characodon lateralis]|uniref:Uncharacterized protein n=1 Tax=Characodon lateralis TaxID=208331 RepID=A0ABU7EAP8_9TELE|nr:hypothetical protein [Characodon lateralis]